MGVGQSSLYPCILTFLEHRINITTTVTSLFNFAGCLTSIGLPILLGNFIETYPLVYVYINLSGIFAAFLMFFCIAVLDRCFVSNLSLSVSTTDLIVNETETETGG